MSTSPASRSTRRVTVAISLSSVCLGTLAVAACGGDDLSPTQAYCTAVRANLTALESPTISTAEQIETALEMYRSITDRAPIAVQPEWQTVVASLETAATVDPKDPASVQRAADTARRSQPAATRIQQYTQQTCGIDIGTPPPTTNPVTATTLVAPGATGDG